jgi:HAD superfamily hydrolase (TIGR01509 family)
VFDLGGVLLDWDPRHLYRGEFEDEAEMERFLSEVCTLAWHFQHDRGVAFSETIPGLCARFPEHADLIRLWDERYLDMIAGEVPGTVDVLRDLHAAGTKLYVLSNMPSSVWQPIHDLFEWFDLFDGAVISGDEKIVKPDPAIYALLTERFGVAPSRSAFVDDRAENVEAARAHGFTAIQFTDADALRRALQMPR